MEEDKCPHCKSSEFRKLGKWGCEHWKYYCSNCGRATFTRRTFVISKSQGKKVLELYDKGMSYRKIKEKLALDVNYTTIGDYINKRVHSLNP